MITNHEVLYVRLLLSFIMIVFALVPAVAPLLGSFVMFAFDWRAIFFMFIAFVAISTIWMGLRINETISEENRVKFNLRNLVSASGFLN